MICNRCHDVLVSAIGNELRNPMAVNSHWHTRKKDKTTMKANRQRIEDNRVPIGRHHHRHRHRQVAMFSDKMLAAKKRHKLLRPLIQPVQSMAYVHRPFLELTMISVIDDVCAASSLQHLRLVSNPY